MNGKSEREEREKSAWKHVSYVDFSLSDNHSIDRTRLNNQPNMTHIPWYKQPLIDRHKHIECRKKLFIMLSRTMRKIFNENKFFSLEQAQKIWRGNKIHCDTTNPPITSVLRLFLFLSSSTRISDTLLSASESLMRFEIHTKDLEMASNWCQMLIGTVRMRIRSGAMISRQKEEWKWNKIIYLLVLGMRKQNANKFYTLYLQKGVIPIGLSLSLSLFLSLTSSVRFLHCIVTSFKMQFSKLIPKLVHCDCEKGWNESPKCRSHQKNDIQILCTLQNRFSFRLALLI